MVEEFVINQLPDEQFELVKGATQIGVYTSLEAAETAKKEAQGAEERKAQSELDDARILRSIDQIDEDRLNGSSETLVKKLSGEDRIDALLRFLHFTHGIHVPYEIAPKD